MALHRGKISTKPEILSVRPLTREDLALIPEKREPIHGIVRRFRDPHHRVARLFASGLRVGEVVERSGYSYNRVKTLHDDPAFQQLIAKYREKVDASFVANADEFYDLATSNMRKAETMIAERLEKAEEEDIDLPLKTLVDISGDRMDRFGYGKRQTNLNVNADFASLLEKAIQRSGKTIEAVVNPSSRVAPPRESLPLALEESHIEAQSPPQSPERSLRPNVAQGPQLEMPARANTSRVMEAGPQSADVMLRRAIA